MLVNCFRRAQKSNASTSHPFAGVFERSYNCAMALVASLAGWQEPSTSTQGAKQYAVLAEWFVLIGLVETDEIKEAFRLVNQDGRSSELFTDFLDTMDGRFQLVQREAMRYIHRLEESAAVSVVPQTENIITEMLERLAVWLRAWGLPLRSFNEPKMISTFTTTFHQLLHSTLPSTFPAHLESYLFASLSRLPNLDEESSTSNSMKNLQRIPPPSPHLTRLGVIPRYSTVVSRVAHEEISRIAREEAVKGWDERRLGRARQRVGDGVANWLAGMYDGNDQQIALRPMFSRFDYFLCKCFFDIRTDELFDIIVDYPDSMAALDDLKECLFKVDQRSVLVDKLKAANLKRLLHPGAETKDVIQQYISTIRCLRILDPPGVLLHKVADPIRKHLRDRPDTIRCIVTTLVEGEELQDENEASGGLISSTNDDTVEDFTDPKWEPEPVDAAPEFRSGKASDIISTLVSIYETREVIIKELQVLLATRLLAVKDYDAVREADKEVRTIELLKIRFGEQALQVCDVMLKDMADSKRIDDRVGSDLKTNVHPLVISRMFWPPFQASSLHLPPKLAAVQEAYEAAFHRFKPDKRLRWLQNAGTPTVKLEFADRIVEVEATPIQASIAELFEQQAKWTTDELVQKLSLGNNGVVKNALAFWASHGVVKEDGGVWVLLEDPDNIVEPSAMPAPVLAAAPLPPPPGSAKAVVVWFYVTRILTNIGPQHAREIHHHLRLVRDYDMRVEQLEGLLEAARQRGLVDLRADRKWALVAR
ncbi:hypothetical protein BCR39DRAFT_593973 [Naematelia encephala]|uniref:Cullin family profile domain-containing protein n=1 Tax=Naematelia encephala TaxID=71784 RepID=A0A1Y2B2Q2_9TREE|nr:hypothetical protein BCR39DRAFT_593973 [Naematelia encephala]